MLRCRSLSIILIFFQSAFAGEADLQVLAYIEKSWDLLIRDNWMQASVDPKLAGNGLIIYVSHQENLQKVKAKNKHLSPKIKFAYLPKDSTQIKEHGLLYLPYPYIVPGGRFNEMYAWDSYFIELGLIENNRITLAKYMVDNLIYEIKNYGTILNANRTYYLGRTQPPLLTEMILAYYKKDPNKFWLKSTLPAIENLYHYWVSPPHLIPRIGLSRYYSEGKGPTPEESISYYEKVRHYFRSHTISDYDKSQFYHSESDQLTDLFYIADRTIRESGFDITAKYGPFGAGILDYAPVDLNVLIYQMERDVQSIHDILGNSLEAKQWGARAQRRIENINKYLWDESTGYYLDYDFKKQKRKYYPFATTFYPLWAGIASEKQAKAVVGHVSDLLRKGGIVTSLNHSGLQWDAPFGWAPMQYFAVIGLERYGYKKLAMEVAKRFITTVNSGFQKNNVLFEKYDVDTLSTRTDNKIKYSYSSNEIGFGWTNGVYLIFNKLLPKHSL